MALMATYIMYLILMAIISHQYHASAYTQGLMAVGGFYIYLVAIVIIAKINKNISMKQSIDVEEKKGFGGADDDKRNHNKIS